MLSAGIFKLLLILEDCEPPMFMTHQFTNNMMPFDTMCDSGEIGTKHLSSLGGGKLAVWGMEEVV